MSQDRYPMVHQVDLYQKKPNKHKKKKKKKRSFLNILSIFILPIALYMSAGFLSFSVLTSDGQNIAIKIGLILMLLLLISVLLLARLLFLRSKKKIGTNVVNTLLVLLLLLVNTTNYFYMKTFGTFDIITSNKEYIRFILVVPEGSDITSIEMLDGKTIGFQSATSKEGTILPKSELEALGIDFESQHYTSYPEALDAMFLFSQVDALIIPSVSDPRITGTESYAEIDKMVTTLESFSVELIREQTNNTNVYNKPFTILISGIDARTGDVTENSMSDVIMLATVNPETKHASLISIPRDSYIPITCQGNQSDKITHSGASGIGCTVDSAAQFLDIKIDYFIKIDFEGVLKIVNAMGGIELDVPATMDGVCEQDSSDFQDVICFHEGTHILNGEEALAFARHRSTLLRGDFDRNYHQQLVLSAMLTRLSHAGPEMINPLLNAMPGSVATDLSTEQLIQLMQLAISLGDGASPYSTFGSFHVQRVEITGDDLNIGDGVYYFQPSYESTHEASRMINDIINANARPIPDFFEFVFYRPEFEEFE